MFVNKIQDCAYFRFSVKLSPKIPSGSSNSVRGVFGGGHPASNVMDYINIKTLSDAHDFGDLFLFLLQIFCENDSQNDRLN